MVKLNTIWKSMAVNVSIKLNLYKSLVVSVLLYECKTWTLNAEMERRIGSFEMTSCRKLLDIHIHLFLLQIRTIAGEQEPLLITVKRRTLSWSAHVNRRVAVAKTNLKGRDKRKRGRQRKAWVDNINDGLA